MARPPPFQTLAANFSGGLSAPVEIVVDGTASYPRVKRAVDALRGELAKDRFFGPSQVTVNQAGNLTLISAPLNGDPSSKAATAAIGRVRSQELPAAFPKGTPAKVLVVRFKHGRSGTVVFAARQGEKRFTTCATG